jgi:hypothetical protein
MAYGIMSKIWAHAACFYSQKENSNFPPNPVDCSSDPMVFSMVLMPKRRLLLCSPDITTILTATMLNSMLILAFSFLSLLSIHLAAIGEAYT